MSWEPLPHEAELFHEVYIDESSWNAHHYLVIGALVFPMKYADQFEQAILASRGSKLPVVNPSGKAKVMKWEKVSKWSLANYKDVVDAFFLFPNTCKARTWEHIEVHTTAIDLTKIEHRNFGDGDPDIGFNKELYFLCARRVARRYDKALFHVYADRRETKQPLKEVQSILNFGMRKYGDSREWPFRRFQFGDPEHKQALQIVDILIGALAFKLNGHYDKPNANPAKKTLSDYILGKARIARPFENTRNTGRFTLFHHKHSPFPKKR
jgi:hypothetical protein